MNAAVEPRLAPPGAGLPKLELFIGRLLFAWSRRTHGREYFTAQFCRERERIRQLVRSCDPKSAARRVLIQRARGMEDSSRYWSIWMTLEHLRLVHESFIRVITQLAEGKVPAGRASTAAVKPSPDITETAVVEYERSCDELLAAVEAVDDLSTQA